jgi:hypothetical protein
MIMMKSEVVDWPFVVTYHFVQNVEQKICENSTSTFRTFLRISTNFIHFLLDYNQ